jgi:microcystin-dependent protein
MKTKLILQALVMLFCVLTVSAQKSINYKALINDSDGNVLANALVVVQFTILENGSTNVYQELHTPATDDHGIIVINIGEGTIISGDFKAIDWGGNPHFLKTEINTGDGLTDMGTTEFKYVPYAHHAETAYQSIIDEVNDADADPVNELQELSLSNDTIFLSQDGFVILPVLGPAGADEDDLMSYDGENWVARSALLQNTGGNQAQNNVQPFLGIYHIIALQGIFPSRNAGEPFLGEIMMVGFGFAPRGWAMCDGQILPISQYQALYSLMGTTFGGDGRTTFALPDLRGRTTIHPGTGPGLSTRTWGERGGSEMNIMTVGQMPAHNHNITYH